MIAQSRSVATSAPLPAEAAYDLSAPFYDGWSWQAFWREHEFPEVKALLERFRRSRRQAPSLLDVGCGTGWYLERLRSICREEVGIDVSRGMLAVARGRLPATFLTRADARHLPFQVARFDAVICCRVLSHMPDPAMAVNEMRRVLVPGGLLVLSDVDAAHDYEFTRLPVAGSHVLADTFKHSRDQVLEDVTRAGFVHDTTHLLHADGSVESSRKREPVGSGGPVAGWIASWRKARNGSL